MDKMALAEVSLAVHNMGLDQINPLAMVSVGPLLVSPLVIDNKTLAQVNLVVENMALNRVNPLAIVSVGPVQENPLALENTVLPQVRTLLWDSVIQVTLLIVNTNNQETSGINTLITDNLHSLVQEKKIEAQSLRAKPATQRKTPNSQMDTQDPRSTSLDLHMESQNPEFCQEDRELLTSSQEI